MIFCILSFLRFGSTISLLQMWCQGLRRGGSANLALGTSISVNSGKVMPFRCWPFEVFIMGWKRVFKGRDTSGSDLSLHTQLVTLNTGATQMVSGPSETPRTWPTT